MAKLRRFGGVTLNEVKREPPAEILSAAREGSQVFSSQSQQLMAMLASLANSGNHANSGNLFSAEILSAKREGSLQLIRYLR